MSVLNLTSVVQRDLDILSTIMDNETIMMSVEHGKYFVLNAVGTELWAKMETPVTIDALVKSISEKFEIAVKDCCGDTLELLTDLHERRLVRLVD